MNARSNSYFRGKKTNLIPKQSKRERTRILNTQLSAYFRERILDGRLPAGTRLPTDDQLATEYQLSREAVRQALSLLVGEGLIERVQGRGTFVCQPSASVSALAIEQKQIGLILNNTKNMPANMDILIGVEQAIKLHGYSVNFSYSEGSQEQQARDIARLRAHQVVGMIIYPAGDIVHDAAIEQLSKEHIPFVLIDRYIPELETDYVGVANTSGAYRATEHLLILGHKRIAFVFMHHETLLTTSVQERWQGYCKALKKYGIAYDETLVATDYGFGPQRAKQGIIELLQHPDRPSAIFAVNDYVALDVLHVAHTLNIRVPDDLAIVGFDDESFAAYTHPPLTTLAQPFLDIGLRAGTLLMSRLEGVAGPPKHIELPTSLIVRESCGARLHVQRALAM